MQTLGGKADHLAQNTGVGGSSPRARADSSSRLAVAFGFTPWRLLVDEYNQGNLQSLLTYLWFVILTSAFMTGSFINAFMWTSATPHVPLFVAIQPGVWVLAGIVLGGATMNRLVDSAHAASKAPDAATESSWANEPDRLGRMYLPSKPMAESQNGTLASTMWLLKETVTGRQKGTENTIEIGALQQLLLQASTSIGYIVATGILLYRSPPDAYIAALPGLPPELLTMLGVSAGGQALNAAVPAPPKKG